jgi:small conductance mechanosensitive channel
MQIEYPSDIDEFNKILGTSEGKGNLLKDLGVILNNETRTFTTPISKIEKSAKIAPEKPAKSAKIAIIVITLISAVGILGIPTTGLIAALSALAAAIALALQGSLSNIAGGIMLVLFKPFEIGDYIESTDVSGTVVDIGLFYSTLTTPDNKKVVVPNGTISNSVITNYSAHDTRRIDFDFSIAYSADINTAKKVLLACAKADEKILADPQPAVMVVSHNDSSITIRLRVWVKNADYWDV